MEGWITDFMTQFGYLSIFLLIALENVFPPVPSEIILAFGGFMTTYTTMTIPGVVAFATVGSVFGAVILYGVGSVMDIRRLEKLIGRWGHILGVEVKHIHKAASYFDRYGRLTVFFCRMIPIIRSVISIPAGMCRMKPALFLFYTAAGTLIWNSLLVSGGALLGESWKDILKFMNVYSRITVVVILTAAAATLFWFSKRIWNYRKK